MNNSIKLMTVLILAAVCGTIYLLVFGLFKSDRPLYFGVALQEVPHAENSINFNLVYS